MSDVTNQELEEAQRWRRAAAIQAGVDFERSAKAYLAASAISVVALGKPDEEIAFGVGQLVGQFLSKVSTRGLRAFFIGFRLGIRLNRYLTACLGKSKSN